MKKRSKSLVRWLMGGWSAFLLGASLSAQGTAPQVRFSEEVPLSYRAYDFDEVGRVGAYYYAVRTNRNRTFFEIDLFDAASLRRRRTFEAAVPARPLAFRPTDSTLNVWGEDYHEGRVLLVVATYALDGRLLAADTLLRRKEPALLWQRHFTVAPPGMPGQDAVGVWFPRSPRRREAVELWVFSNADRRILWHQQGDQISGGTILPMSATATQAAMAFRKDRLIKSDIWYYAHARPTEAVRFWALGRDSIHARQPRMIWPFHDSLMPAVGYLTASTLFPDRMRGYGWFQHSTDGLPRMGSRRWPMDMVKAIRGMDAQAPYLENLSLLAVYPMEGNRRLYLTEINYKRAEVFQQTTAFGQVQTTRRIFYFSDEVVAFLVDTNHDIRWFQVLRKHQVSQDDNALYSSVGRMVQQTRLILFYNNMHQRFWNSEMWIVDPLGNTRRRILFSQKKQPLDVVWRKGRQVGYETFLAPAYTRRGDQYRLVRVSVPEAAL